MRLRLVTHLGAGAYICGEETALLESLEGKLGQPRLRPPFPATAGLYGAPTVINNVETLANLPPILDQGAGWYRTLGTEKSPGTKIFCLSGRIARPGNYELPLGVKLGELVYELGGGMIDGRPFKALLPSGAASRIIPITSDEILDTPLDYQAISSLGSSLGSASMIIIDDTVDMDWLAHKAMHFFRHESCGKCTSCRVGTRILVDTLDKITQGEGEPGDLLILKRVADTMDKTALCGLGQAASNPVACTLRSFLSDYEAHIYDRIN